MHKTIQLAIKMAGAIGLICISINASAAGWRFLSGHIPEAISHLRPIGRLAATNEINLAISLSLRNQSELTNFLEQLYNPASTNYSLSGGFWALLPVRSKARFAKLRRHAYGQQRRGLSAERGQPHVAAEWQPRGATGLDHQRLHFHHSRRHKQYHHHAAGGEFILPLGAASKKRKTIQNQTTHHENEHN